jgi:hypothetical protein
VDEMKTRDQINFSKLKIKIERKLKYVEPTYQSVHVVG